MDKQSPLVETDSLKWRRKEERRDASFFLLGLLSLYAVWYFTAGHTTPARVGAIGGSISFMGVVIMAWPVIRVGVYQWILNVVWESEFPVEERAPSTECERELRRQRASDLIKQNVFGPYLVGVGTIINGFSGLF